MKVNALQLGASHSKIFWGEAKYDCALSFAGPCLEWQLSLRSHHQVGQYYCRILKVSKGAVPESVVVNFEIANEHDQDFDLHVPKFVYHSQQGASGVMVNVLAH